MADEQLDEQSPVCPACNTTEDVYARKSAMEDQLRPIYAAGGAKVPAATREAFLNLELKCQARDACTADHYPSGELDAFDGEGEDAEGIDFSDADGEPDLGDGGPVTDTETNDDGGKELSTGSNEEEGREEEASPEASGSESPDGSGEAGS